MNILEGILKLKRPAGGCTEREMINKYIKPTGAIADIHGNYHLKIGNTPIVWSSHTDTVHDKNGTQNIAYGAKDGCIYLKEQIKKAECLGADDGGGIWLMIKMIDAGVEGHYVFHREEETGGHGSFFLATSKEWQEYFSDYKAVIALDRRGYNDVITHQGSRTCSTGFAQELSNQLNGLMYPTGLNEDDKDTMKYYKWRPSRGVWTDSANYTDMVGECTNLSIGYFSQHSYLECQDPQFLKELLKCLVALDTEALLNACERKPGEKEAIIPAYKYSYLNQMTPQHGGIDLIGDSIDVDFYPDDDCIDALSDMEGIIERYPDEVAVILKHHGYDYSSLLDEIDTISGAINA